MKCGYPNCKTNQDFTERELDIHMRYFHKVTQSQEQPQMIMSGVCPDCGATLWMQEGCATCHSCGFQKC